MSLSSPSPKQNNSFFRSLLQAYQILMRYLRLRFQARLHSPLWKFLRGNEEEERALEALAEAEEARRQAEEEARLQELAEKTLLQAAPEPHKPSLADRLLARFNDKLHAREDRKRRVRKKTGKKSEDETDDDRQLEFEFEMPEAASPDSPLADNGSTYQLPPLSMFLQEESKAVDWNESRINSKKLQDCLDNYGIDADVIGTIHGPRITLYQIRTAPSVPLAKLISIEREMALALAARSLRLLAPVPGETFSGVEIPNGSPETVRCGNIMNGLAWQQNKMLLPIIVGRDIKGEDCILDLAKAPHLLVAGTTGSGKSVCLNSFIVSLASRFRPDELKMILVDPKFVEMAAYTKLPHLLVPVINDVQLVVLALRWLIHEMYRRVAIFKIAKVRNLEDFNKRPLQETPELDQDGVPIPPRMPFIVAILDELADIMLLNKQEVESSLVRIAQYSRAAGIHLIIATQRPSVDVVTGLIKTNFPMRIAFKTSSVTDSRVILDGKGAESLLGQGDMLYTPPTGNLKRAQGAMITDREIDAMVSFCASQKLAPTGFALIQTAETAKPAVSDNSEEENQDSIDEKLIQEAMRYALQEHRCSISYFQRRLGIGYNRSASLVEKLEKRGYIGPQIPSHKDREILVDSI